MRLAMAMEDGEGLEGEMMEDEEFFRSDSVFSDAPPTPAVSTPRSTPMPPHLDETTVSIELPPRVPRGSFMLEEALVDSRPASVLSENTVISEQPQRLSPLPSRWASSHSKLTPLWILNNNQRTDTTRDCDYIPSPSPDGGMQNGVTGIVITPAGDGGAVTGGVTGGGEAGVTGGGVTEMQYPTEQSNVSKEEPQSTVSNDRQWFPEVPPALIGSSESVAPVQPNNINSNTYQGNSQDAGGHQGNGYPGNGFNANVTNGTGYPGNRYSINGYSSNGYHSNGYNGNKYNGNGFSGWRRMLPPIRD